MIDFISPTLYQTIYFTVLFSLSVVLAFSYVGSNNCQKLLHQNSIAGMLILAIIVIWFIGFRPISWRFGDMWTYYKGYISPSAYASVSKSHSEWVWDGFLMLCKQSGLKATFFFFLISLVYFGAQFLAIKKLVWENTWMGILFVLTAFSCYTYSVNGLRNGMACSIFVLALSIFSVDRKYLIPSLLCIIALGIHKSVALPVACAIAAIWLIKKPKYAIYIWLASILLSFVAGGTFASLASGIGFDDRMQSYFGNQNNSEGTYLNTSFRWDFLLYSAMPVFLTWYMSVKRKINDRIFNILSITYILTNAFWVLIIRAPFSNRFAYLSWALYPFVLAYAIIRVPIWKDQDRKAGIILLAHAGFTFIMYLLGKAA